MANPQQTRNKLDGFDSIASDWAQYIHNDYLQNGFKDTSAFLGQNGEIQINAYSAGFHIDIVIEVDGNADFVAEYNGKEFVDEEQLSFVEILTRLKFWSTQWFMQGLSDKVIINTRREDSQVLHSVFQVTGGFQQLPWNVQRGSREEYVSISVTDTPATQKSRQFTSKSVLIPYPQTASSLLRQ